MLFLRQLVYALNVERQSRTERQEIMSVAFKVIIPSYNSVQWLRKTLHSVAIQTYRNFAVCVIDDASTQTGQRDIIQEYCSKYQWTSLLREENHGALANIVEGINLLSPQDDDAIILLDGDDWLFDKHVFAKVARIYQEESVLMTYGQFITYPRWQMGFCAPLSETTIKHQNYRDIPFQFSHLRTFKYKMWRHIREEDLKDASGHYFKTAWDLSLMYPLLEMSGGEGCRFIDHILYVYNMDNPLNDCVAHKALQEQTAQYIRRKRPYARLFSEQCIPRQPRLSRTLWNQWITLYKKIITPKVYRLAVRKLWKTVSGLQDG